jgi:hypothetical protein
MVILRLATLLDGLPTVNIPLVVMRWWWPMLQRRECVPQLPLALWLEKSIEQPIKSQATQAGQSLPITDRHLGLTLGLLTEQAHQREAALLKNSLLVYRVILGLWEQPAAPHI